MKNKLFYLFSLVSFIGYSQSFIGFKSDNYNGVNGVIYNPANIVDSRFKTDINLVGASAFVNNDYAAVKISDLFAKDYNFNKQAELSLYDKNNVVVNLDILGPSFMFNLAPKHAIAISTRVRGMVNLMDVNGETISLIDNELTNSESITIPAENINTSANTWAELGLSYATVLMDKNEHFLKGGLTLKYLQGLGSANGHSRNMEINYDKASNSIDTKGTINYGYTSNFENEFEDFEILDNATGFGTDLGFVYEWRPNVEDYKYKNNKGVSNYYKDVNKYKLKLGLSFTDIGSINYKDAIQETYSLNRTGITEAEYSQYDGIKNTLRGLFGAPETKNTTKANLPTAMHFNADLKLKNNFYLNLDTNFDISGDDFNTNSISNSYILTPRFETKWFSAYLPLGMYELSGFQTGFGFRAGPLYVGSGSIITNVIKDKVKATDVYVGLKIPVYQSRPKDRDNDGVFDKIDECPKVAGPAENNGCPWEDSDEDGVLDNVDKCVNVAGPAENNGCPWGDKDNDGVLDNVDECIDVAGPAENKGCPFADYDKDGIADKDDNCPKVAGVKEYRGCPADADGDGVIDAEDKCPKVAGVKENNGCPKVRVITKEAEKKLADFAKAIYFNSAKTTFKNGVTGTLDLIIDVIREYPKANFSIEGHTDSQGAKASNLKLSERRAKAVLNYLVKNGISSNRLTSYGFGEEYPIDTNKTRVGRANNRRVDIKLKK